MFGLYYYVKMCRIAGMISNVRPASEMKLKVKAMCHQMRHGGPDDEGLFLDEPAGVCFGHRRLSLLDLSSAGHQPMCDPAKRCFITFNGEIYNFREIKQELVIAGHHFRSNTDTEVILAAYLQWGTESFKRFNGMFAFALYDQQDQACFLVRDAIGIKPLYYTLRRSGDLYFASEVKAFKQINPNWPQSPDWRLLLLCFGHIPEPHTTLQWVKALPKGHYLQYNLRDRSTSINCYRKLGFAKPRIWDKGEAIALINEKLRSALKRHLISDAPIGLFLSGGIDSSLLTLLADEAGNENLHTLSVTFNDNAYSEEEYQRAVVERIDCTHKNYIVERHDFEDHFEAILQAYDQPSNDGINSWFISKCAHENGLKAVLSGLGSDEIFGGYPSFRRMNSIILGSKLPSYALNFSRHLSQVPLQRLSWLQLKTPIGLYLTIRGLCTPEEAARLIGTSKKDVFARIESLEFSPDLNADLAPDSAASTLEFNLYMQNQLLKDADYMSMKHGLELRVPFLDQELLNAVFSISPSLLYQHGGLPKQLLIDSFQKLLPEKIWNRKKMGFSFPFQKWFGSVPLLTEGITKTPEGKALMQSFNEQQTHWSKVWAYFLTQQFNA